jgi:uncharacterized protein (DUF2235 family)
MPKNIVICCDGTGNEFGTRNSNVVKLFSVLEIHPDTQVAYYDPGLGTMGAQNALTSGAKWLTKAMGLAFGYGLMSNIEDAYRFLMQSWTPGDHLYLFGFSRGAYTARVLASMLHMFGLLPPNNAQLIPYILRVLKHCDDEQLKLAFAFKKVFSLECKPHFVGVWDTVSSVGWIADPLKVRFSANNPDIHIGRHAISIDERRCFFRQNLWGKPGPGQDYKQVWFAGVHSDVGGGYAEPESGLAKVALEWMLSEAGAAGLRTIPAAIQEVLGRLPGTEYVAPDACGPMHNSLKGPWRLLEYVPRRHWNGTLKPPRDEWIIPRRRSRNIAEQAVLHQAVLDRLANAAADYHPPNLPPKYEVEPWSAKVSPKVSAKPSGVGDSAGIVTA